MSDEDQVKKVLYHPAYGVAIAHWIDDPSMFVTAMAELIRKARAEEREACARIAARRSCTWSVDDDVRSQDFRDGIEVAAGQIATAIREGVRIG